MRPGDDHPDTRTSSPYSLTDAVSELTANTAGTDTAVAEPVAGHACRPPSTRSRRTSGPTFDGLTRVVRSRSTSATTRWPTCSKSAAEVTAILARAQPAAQHADPQRQRSARRSRRTALGDRGAAGQHRRRWPGQLTGLVADNEAGARADTRPAQLGDRDAREQPRQHRQGAARTGEIPGDPRRDGGQRPVLQRLRPEPQPGTGPAALHRLRLRLPAWCQRRSTTRQRRPAGRAPVPVQRDSRRGRADAPSTDCGGDRPCACGVAAGGSGGFWSCTGRCLRADERSPPSSPPRPAIYPGDEVRVVGRQGRAPSTRSNPRAPGASSP